MELVNDVARANPVASVVLVGPVRIAPDLFEPRNVHLLDPRPYRDLPAYVQAFDVGLIHTSSTSIPLLWTC